MLYFFSGTDRAKVRKTVDAAAKKETKGAVVRVTDTHGLADLEAALQGGGMFALSGAAGKRAVILDTVLGNEVLRERLMKELPVLRDSSDAFFVIEEKPDAATRRAIEKYAETSEKFDAAKRQEDKSIFALGNALKRGDKKALWVGVVRETIGGKPPEATHGFLFWAAKQMLLSARTDTDRARARKMVAELAELPHESRRRGFDLDYALELFVLSEA